MPLTREQFSELRRNGYTVNQIADLDRGGGFRPPQAVVRSGLTPEEFSSKDTSTASTLLSSERALAESEDFLSNHRVLNFLGRATGVKNLAKGLGQAIFFNLTKEGKEMQRLLDDGKITADEFNRVVGGIVSPGEVFGSAAQTALTVASAGTIGPKAAMAPSATRLGRTVGASRQLTRTLSPVKEVAKAAAYGAGAGAAESVQTEPMESPGAAVGGALFGAAVAGATLGAGRLFTKIVPGALKKVGDISDEAAARSVERPGDLAAAVRAARGMADDGEPLLIDAQKALIAARKDLSKSYQAGKDVLSSEFSGTKLKMSKQQLDLLKRVSGEFGLDVPKGSRSGLDVSSALKLNEDLNELYRSSDVASAASGIPVRKLKDSLRRSMVEAFGGEGTGVDDFLNDYSTRTQMLQNADEIVKAFKTGGGESSPIAQSAALSRLKGVFRENRSSYLRAIEGLENETGLNLLDVVAGFEFKPILPKTIGKFTLEDAFRTMLTPIFSPRLIGTELRAIGRMAKVAKRNPQYAQMFRTLLLNVAAGSGDGEGDGGQDDYFPGIPEEDSAVPQG